MVWFICSEWSSETSLLLGKCGSWVCLLRWSDGWTLREGEVMPWICSFLYSAFQILGSLGRLGSKRRACQLVPVLDSLCFHEREDQQVAATWNPRAIPIHHILRIRHEKHWVCTPQYLLKASDDQSSYRNISKAIFSLVTNSNDNYALKSV